MSLGLGYLVGTAIFALTFLIAVFIQIKGMVQNEAVLGNTTKVISGEYFMFLEGIGA